MAFLFAQSSLAVKQIDGFVGIGMGVTFRAFPKTIFCLTNQYVTINFSLYFRRFFR
jgi:hypothetical protein